MKHGLLILAISVMSAAIGCDDGENDVPPVDTDPAATGAYDDHELDDDTDTPDVDSTNPIDSDPPPTTTDATDDNSVDGDDGVGGDAVEEEPAQKLPGEQSEPT